MSKPNRSQTTKAATATDVVEQKEPVVQSEQAPVTEDKVVEPVVSESGESGEVGETAKDGDLEIAEGADTESEADVKEEQGGQSTEGAETVNDAPASEGATEPAPTDTKEPVVEAQAALAEVAAIAQADTQSRWDVSEVKVAPEVQVMINTLETYSKEMAPHHRIEELDGAYQQATLFRTLLHVVGYANPEHFVGALDVLVEHIRAHATTTFAHRYLFRFLNLQQCPLSVSQRQEFCDFFTVLVAIAVAEPGERALISKAYDLTRSFRLIKNETQLQHFHAYYKRLCNID